MFEIILNNEQSVPCIIPSGRIDTLNSPAFDRAVQNQIGRTQYLVIDLSQCNYLSSTGIRVLLSTFKKLSAKGGILFITSVAPEVYQVFEMAGLHRIFRFSDNCNTAIEEINLIKNKGSDDCDLKVDDFSLPFHGILKEHKPALLWKHQGIAGYNELGFSVGTGMAADSQEEGINSEGLFITTGNCAGFIPRNCNLSSDFRIPHNTAQAGILVKEALSFGNSPTGWFRIFKPFASSLDKLATNIYKNKNQLQNGQQGVMAMVTANFNQEAPGISFSLIVDNVLKEKLKDAGLNDLLSSLPTDETGISLLGARFDCEELAQPTDNPSLENMLKEVLTFENITNVQPVNPEEQLSYPLVWLFITETFSDASENRISLDVPEDGFSEPYKAFLTRRLYSDSKRVVIKALHGGYSAQTFQVNSFDSDGRKLRPTVLKIANRAMITREAERCRNYSLPYILNNSAMVLGTEFFGDFGALCYNFVGIGGEQTQLKWLTNYFDEWPVEKLEPIFDKTFLQILKPWYGQPVHEAIFPFKDHDPTFTFFPYLFDTAENILSVSSNEPFLQVEELNRKVVNPYWFLKHEYDRRRNDSIDYYTAICHGDLNMQNILIDQDMNVYLIDFSETKPRSVISDFARLESIFMVERAPLSNEEEITAMIEFAARFYSTKTLDQLPLNSYSGKGTNIVNKNVALTLKMREYAITSTCGNTNLAPYYMAMLEWVLPIVCFSCTPVHKRFSMIVASLLCERVMELMPG